MRFDLSDLRLFLHVAETGSITQGSRRLNLAVPTASERIRGMEDALGTPLLHRLARRGVQLTPAGRTLADHARIVLGQIETMRGELSDYALGLKGYVRLLSNTAALNEFLPDTLGPFLAANPNIDIELEEQPSPAIVQAVAAGRADAGIVSDEADLTGLETFPFRVDRLVLVVPRGHKLAARRKAGFHDALDEEFVGLNRDSALQIHIGRQAAREGKRLKLRVRLGSFEAICRMVEGGVGVAVVPATAARRYQKQMAIRIIGLTEPWTLRHLTICVRRLDALSPPAKLLVAHLRRHGDKAAAPRKK